MARVLVVGSHREDDHRRDLFQQVCEEIGEALVQGGHQLAVCSHSADCADPHVVAGASRGAAIDAPARVTHFVSNEDLEALDGADGYPPNEYPLLNLETVLTHDGWFATYDFAIEKSDVVLALGGTPRGTGGATYIALSKGRPVLAVPGTGGFSLELWHEFEREYSALPNDDERALRSRDPARIASATLRSIDRLVKDNPFPRQPRGWRYIAFPVAMLACGAAWLYVATSMSFARSWTPYLVILPTALGGLLFGYATDDARSRHAYAGVAKVAKDITRVFGVSLAVGVLLHLVGAQVHLKSGSADSLLTSWLGLAGFYAGFQIEPATETVRRVLGSFFSAMLRAGKQE